MKYVLVLFSLLIIFCGRVCAVDAKQPNILFILVDD